LIKLGVVISINGLHVLEFIKITKGISQTHQFVNGHLVLDSFDHVDDVVNLVTLEHFHEEGIERVRCLTDDEFDLVEKFFFHGATEKRNVGL
jgi:hypothetical protein